VLEKKCPNCVHPVAEDKKFCPDCVRLVDFDLEKRLDGRPQSENENDEGVDE